MASRPRINLKAGNHRVVRIAIQTTTGSARNLTGETIEFRAAVNLSASATTIYKTDGDGIEIVNDDPTLGYIDIVFQPSDTLSIPELLLFEIKVTDQAGDPHTLDFDDTGLAPLRYGLLQTEPPLLATG